jgi:hypothetical protein
MKKLVEYTISIPEYKVLAENENLKTQLINLKDDGDSTLNLVKLLWALWNDPEIQFAFKTRSRRILLFESLDYWMRK